MGRFWIKDTSNGDSSRKVIASFKISSLTVAVVVAESIGGATAEQRRCEVAAAPRECRWHCHWDFDCQWHWHVGTYRYVPTCSDLYYVTVCTGHDMHYLENIA